MAGASGGRKAVCPGLIGEESTYIFHGAGFLSSPNARDLVLAGIHATRKRPRSPGWPGSISSSTSRLVRASR